MTVEYWSRWLMTHPFMVPLARRTDVRSWGHPWTVVYPLPRPEACTKLTGSPSVNLEDRSGGTLFLRNTINILYLEA